MNFQELINFYISELNCSVKDLATASGLSVATISRYKSGERKPFIGSNQLDKLIEGLLFLDHQSKNPHLNKEEVINNFQKSLNLLQNQTDIFSRNFNALIELLPINMKNLANATNFDISYLYRIRQGQRRPYDLDGFSDLFCSYVAQNLCDPTYKQKIADYLKEDVLTFSDESAYYFAIKRALATDPDHTKEHMNSFLTKLDNFNLDQFIKSIHFDELKVPTVPFSLPTSKNYYGVEQMRKGELDFFKATVLSTSKEPIFMCSDMPMADMAKDDDFNKKWMFGIAASLKKGLHLNIIHNIDRPFNEMMLGLEAWIPIYMTGQVSPYHLKNVSTDVYHHFTYVSGAAALSGECINGFHDNGKYHLTNSKEEITYYRKRADNLLQKASSLMDIYTESEKPQFNTFLDSLLTVHEDSRNIFSSLPLYTISEDLLLEILDVFQLSTIEKNAILNYHRKQIAIAESILSENELIDEISFITKEEFEKYPMHLSLSGIFLEKEISYTYEQYIKHFDQTKQFAKTHDNYTLKTDVPAVFRNIQIHIIGNESVVISKNIAPTIHFVIHHKKMVNALSQFVPPIV